MAQEGSHYVLVTNGIFCRLQIIMAGSSMRLVRLKPQDPGPDRVLDRPVQKKFIQSSSDSNLLSAPRVCTCFGSHSFAVAAPTIWNTPSLYIFAVPLPYVVFVATSKHFSTT